MIYGAGTAGLGIADMMRAQMIREGLSAQKRRVGSTPWPAKGYCSATTQVSWIFSVPTRGRELRSPMGI